MKIVVSYAPVDRYAGEIVATALVRSFSIAQVTRVETTQAAPPSPAAANSFVWINPPEETCADLARFMHSGGKAIVLGRIGPRIAETLGLTLRDDVPSRADFQADWAECPVDATRHHDASQGAIRYDDTSELAAVSPIRTRELCRYDFADEWNNRGFGRITFDGGPWSLQSEIEIGAATPIALVITPRGDRLVYAALAKTSSAAVLWFNRPVGPVDSLEWRVVESFLGDYRPDDLPCFPYVSEIPAGYRAAVCARLDCDEAVVSSGPLADLYQARGVPLSLALLTGQPLDRRDVEIIERLVADGGSVVSHSVHHTDDWGGSYDRARSEALESRAWIEQHLPAAAPVRYAVSPFHKNPPFAVQALADCQYQGFVGGIIANDPEYLLGRAGRVPFVSRPIVSLSAQCMLHGDCYRRYRNSIDVYCESFDAHAAAQSIFGYLDHPFSDRYQYGWPDEPTRLDAHRQLIDHIERLTDVWWANLNDVLDFLVQRDQTLVQTTAAGKLLIESSPAAQRRPLAILWKGEQFAH
jgi:hypothetical protein